MINWAIPLLSGFIITAVFMPSLIKYFRSKHEGQMIREEGPSWHEKNQGHLRWAAFFLLSRPLFLIWYLPGFNRC